MINQFSVLVFLVGHLEDNSVCKNSCFTNPLFSWRPALKKPSSKHANSMTVKTNIKSNNNS